EARIERFASALSAGVCGNRGLVFGRGFGGRCARLGESFGFVEEQILLLIPARLALRGEELSDDRVQPLLEQVTLGTYDAQFPAQRVAFLVGALERGSKLCDLRVIVLRHTHRRVRPAMRNTGSLTPLADTQASGARAMPASLPRQAASEAHRRR